jgi:hypothetical protein
VDPCSTAFFLMHLFVVLDSLPILADVHVYKFVFKRSRIYTEMTVRVI